MTKLCPLEYAVALRLRTVSDDAKPAFQKASEELQSVFSLTAEHVSDAREQKVLLCDRCLDVPTKLPVGSRVWAIPFFKMCICDDCEREVRSGGSPLHPRYFEDARAILLRFFSGGEIDRLAEHQDARQVIQLFDERFVAMRNLSPAGARVHKTPMAAYLPAIFSALLSIVERNKLADFYALPMGPEEK